MMNLKNKTLVKRKFIQDIDSITVLMNGSDKQSRCVALGCMWVCKYEHAKKNVKEEQKLDKYAAFPERMLERNKTWGAGGPRCLTLCSEVGAFSRAMGLVSLGFTTSVHFTEFHL